MLPLGYFGRIEPAVHNPNNSDAKITKIRDGRVHLTYKAVYANRRRIRRKWGKMRLRKRSELVQRSLAHCSLDLCEPDCCLP
jgi:hypothetical protein